ncbi:MAG: pyridoxamine 5'-phosphate oxidase family protein [Acidimicrobiales bacterium]
MRTVDGRTGLERIDRDECLRLLAADEVGRLAVITGGSPAILPVNYRLDGEAIVFRSDPGTKLDDGPRSRACFEIDHFDRPTHSGWSVVVTGRLEEVTRYDSTALHRVQRLPIDPWAGGAKDHWVRLVPERITGRRLHPPAALAAEEPGPTGPAPPSSG